MIRLHNSGELEQNLVIPGTQAIADNQDVVIAPFNGIISAIFARLATPGTVSGAQNTDVQKNGTTIFASGAAAIQFAVGASTPTYGAIAAANPTPVVKGDIIKLKTTAVHGTPGAGLAVFIVFRRGRSAYSSSVVETDTVSSASDTL